MTQSLEKRHAARFANDQLDNQMAASLSRAWLIAAQAWLDAPSRPSRAADGRAAQGQESTSTSIIARADSSSGTPRPECPHSRRGGAEPAAQGDGRHAGGLRGGASRFPEPGWNDRSADLTSTSSLSVGPRTIAKGLADRHGYA